MCKETEVKLCIVLRCIMVSLDANGTPQLSLYRDEKALGM